VDQILRDDMARAMAVRRDLSYYRGAGAVGEPKGVRNWLPSGQKFNSTGTTAAAKVADLAKAMKLVADGNFDLNGAAWAMSPRSWFGLFGTTTTTGDHLFMGMLSLGTLYGAPARMTASIPDTIATDKSEVYFGLHREALIGLDIGNPTTIEFFPNGSYGTGSSSVSGISRNQSVLRIIEGHDIALRQSKAFGLIEAVAWA
jgi:HK97 family phage major capsid protein